MKTIFKTILCASFLVFSSCKSEIEKSADDFCACFKIEKMKDRNACTDEWLETYKDIEISDEEIKEMTKRVEECSDGGLTSGRYEHRINKIKK